MSRTLTIGAAQLGPIARDASRPEVVARLIALLRRAKEQGCQLIAYPELALTSFFPRWHLEDPAELDAFFEREMPSLAVEPLFDEARRLEVGFSLGYAELTLDGHRYNTQILVERDGSVLGKYRKVHLPGHADHQPGLPFQHLERLYFEPGPEGFLTWRAFGGIVGMAICNDRRWPECYRVLALRGCELVLIGYNTPIHYAPDPGQDVLASFHNHLVMQAGAYQNGMWVVGVAKGGREEGVDSLAESAIIAPSGRIVASCASESDELAVARCDLDLCKSYKETLFDFERYRMPEHYGLITERRGARFP